MIDNLTLKQKKEIGEILKKYLRGKESGYQKIKRIPNKVDRDAAFKKAYDLFSKSKEDAYKVANIYGLKVCPYCNINYTYVVIDEDDLVCRPDFDHFVRKDDCPKKALNVLNLVPSCQQCNSRVKNKKHFSLRHYIHPFYDNFDSCFKFDYNLIKPGLISDSNLEIEINPIKEQERTSNFINEMHLKARYQHHKNIVLSIMKRAQRYPVSSANFMKKYSKLCNQNNLIDLIYPELSADTKNESLGKLKEDIATKIFAIMIKDGKL